ncbi:hypothetical protein SNE510_09510 [Streptomyces sp. NE5-10]|uniref:hypothetical protein n=1 Tax=Streptomyces sp. NE5-10 TaxID=2759674 RepID=UPI001904E92A|nr:hypothetical protein [Streptomyces sp. NE5-10]GHJ91432.1 hypothetical protein SNE510_09510 [Streptomyces sp. NE5-10]
MIATAAPLLAALAPLSHSARLRFTAVTAHRLAARGDLRPLLDELDALGPYERRLAALAALAAGDTAHLLARLGDLDPVVRRYALRGARRLPAPSPTPGPAASAPPAPTPAPAPRPLAGPDARPAAGPDAGPDVDAAVEAAYHDAPAVVRADLARSLRDGRRPALAERLVRRVRVAYGDRDAALLLPGCSPEFTARLLPELAGALEPEDWSTLARRHPGAVLDHAERELAGLTGRSRDAWWARYALGPAAALPAAPERVLRLLEAHGPDTLPGPVHERLGDLVAVDAERVARWFTRADRHVARWERTPGPAVLRRLVAADPPSLPALGALWFHRGAFPTLLRSVPPERRGAFLDAVVAAAGPRGNVRAHGGVLALLPPAERHARARAAVAELRDTGRPEEDVRDMLALLPPAEARPALLAALATGDADERGTAWDRLITNAGLSRDPRQVATLLGLASRRLAHERDGVRGDVLDALAGIPTPLLTAALEAVGDGSDGDGGAEGRGAGVAEGRAGEGGDASAALERLCLDALAARDRSPMTRDAVRTLAVALLSDAAGSARHDRPAARLAARLLEALTAHTGTIELGSLQRRLNSDGIRVAVRALAPWLDRSAARGEVAPLLALVASCGRRSYAVPELQDRLEEALGHCPDGVFGDVAAAWLADPASRGGRVAALLAREPSAVFLPPVLAVLAAERTDRLDPALAERPPLGGRFPAAGAPRALPPFRHADRWLPSQQAAAVRLAAEAVADPGRGVDERAALLRAVAPIPVHGRALLLRYAAAAPGPDAPRRDDAGTSVLAAAALDAAAHTDDPASALGTLLAHAGDDRAAAAWSAAARAAAHARPTRVAALLREVLTRPSGVKVSVRKAAARLAARHLPPADATALLTAVGRTPGVHPDVRATVVGLAAILPLTEELWTLLESAVAEGPEPARLALLDVRPADLAAAHRGRFGELVARLPFVAQEETAYRALSELALWARYAPAAGTALVDAYTDLTRPGNPWQVSSGLTELAGSELPHPLGGAEPGSLLHEVVARLLALVAAGEPEGGGRGGDLPALRRLRSLLDTRRLDHRTCARLARQLADEPLVTGARVGLLARAVDLTAPKAELTAAIAELYAVIEDRPVLAVLAAEDLDEAHRYGTALGDPTAALAVARTLGEDGGLVPGLLAVALTHALGARQGWPDACRTALIALRRHPEADVREQAHETDLSDWH